MRFVARATSRWRFLNPRLECMFKENSCYGADVCPDFNVCEICVRDIFIHSFVHSFSHSVVCHTAGSQPLPKRVLQTVRSIASSFNFQYPLFSLRSSNSYLLLLPRLPVTCFLSSIFPSTKCSRRQFMRESLPIQSVCLLFIACRMLVSFLTLCNTSSF